MRKGAQLMSLTGRARRSLAARFDRWLPDWPVSREVQGVHLVMPRAHKLPQIAERFPGYGQNLVKLAVALTPPDGPLIVLDVGANIGDSAAQVLNATDARIWCIEGDPYWLPFLQRNLGSDSRVSLTHALLLPAGQDAQEIGVVRQKGTTSFRPDGDSINPPRLSVADLARLKPWRKSVRLLKSDTDGFDTRLVPALLDAFAEDRPVVFFEYDPQMSIDAGDPHPEHVWRELEGRGYEDAVVWDNFGSLMGGLRVGEVANSLTLFEEPLSRRSFNYWDVALAHRDDRDGVEVLARMRGPELTR